MRHRRLLLLILVLGVAGAFIARGRMSRVPNDSDAVLSRAQEAFAAGRFDEAERLALRIARGRQSTPAAWLLAGKAAGAAGRPKEGLSHVRMLTSGDVGITAEALTEAGQLNRQLGHFAAAEGDFLKALTLRPEHKTPRRGLAEMYGKQGRFWDAHKLLFQLLRQGDIHTQELLRLGSTWVDLEAPQDANALLDMLPREPILGLRLAHIAIQRGEFEKAKAQLREVLLVFPEMLDARAWLGWVLFRAGDEPGVAEWIATLPEDANEHPLVWVVKGNWNSKHGQNRDAIDCFRQALILDPDQPEAIEQLANCLDATSSDEIASALRRRASQLSALTSTLRGIQRNPQDAPKLLTAARQLEELGRIWEALEWHRAVLRLSPDDGNVLREVARLEDRLTPGSPRVIATANPALLIKRRGTAAPERPIINVATSGLPRETPMEQDKVIRFVDRAIAVGIDFEYLPGDDPSTDGKRIVEAMGGGVAAVDFDGDGWVDLYFTQGGEWPPVDGQTDYLDRLYRNVRGAAFEDVTEAAVVHEELFSHGVATGDWDGDGFVDLYVANHGLNRLLHNMGDGTFQDVTGVAGLAAAHWTTSCLVADLNQDALPELFDVNYAVGNYEQICTGNNGRSRSCRPSIFQAIDDALHRNLGDGRFADCSAEAGIPASDGYGLGIVAADFDGSGRLSLFVANDTTANHYFVNESASPGGELRFVERAVPNGLAFDYNGSALACMGVAAGDANGDGLIDLFVTNYYSEPNSLYVQDSARGFFKDETIRYGLRDPSYFLLGFGTQFIDGDLDGYLDLVLTNGHVDDFTFADEPFAMRPQFYRNRQGRVFEEVGPQELGPFFAGRYRGRGLARLDWNRDGREDVAISHLDSPAALLANESTGVGHFLALQLRGVESNRDAIGTTVGVLANGRRQTSQMTAGDGYQASNQRQLVFGLGTAEVVEEMTVRWLSGREQTFRNLPVDQELVLVEGAPQPVRLPSTER
jgi:tetratricopeptide (TPR) repeat protein